MNTVQRIDTSAGNIEEQTLSENTTLGVSGLLTVDQRDKLVRLSSYVKWHCKIIDSDPDIDPGLFEVFNHIRKDLDFIAGN
ncbi:hypothetical protein GZ77_26770 [Endozoicomonas montiporae]|uniref:Uncharacterized protein n=2 Tax=Endozoicomonas montiporae TaxID=1027273 RepID=A0A081MYC0_9GAMM|nr:hypothetical protein GZ77_26770 [Endozoicomonas montiporae]